MSRGGTRKARAAQAAERRARERKEKVARTARVKEAKAARPKTGRGRATLVHLSGLGAPLVLSLTLGLAGRPSEAEPGTGYWLDGLVSDPNASYVAEPAGLIYAVASLALGWLIFLFAPLWLWRRLNRSVAAPDRDRSAVDTAFTLSAVISAVWLVRVVVGFTDPVSNFAFAMVLLSIYLPVFSGLLALLMPVVPGSGRIGGILPTFMRFPFTKRFLLTEEERRAADAAEQGVRAAAEAARLERRARKKG